MTYEKFKNFYRIIFLSAIIFLPILVQAASFSLRPAKQEIALEPGTSIHKSITITNNLGYNSYFKIKVKNIESSHSSPYLLTDFVNLETAEIFVATDQTKTVYFDIDIPIQTKPGGAYGYFQVIARPISGKDIGASVSAALGSSIFVRIKGPIKEAGRLVSFGIIGGRQVKIRTPLWWHFSFKNSGDIYLNPYGKILLTNKIIGTKQLVDVPPSSVLPGQTRLFEIKLNDLSFPGLYSAVLLLNRGYNNEIDILEIDFWFFPWSMLAIFLVAGLFFIFVFVLRLIRKKNV
ncbi:MAG: hypothetical protein WCX70_00275 [Candidatus Paceibacterota bacterium]|jgi:hypothetical protein